MGINICIDWGNTLVKAGFFENGTLSEAVSYPVDDAFSGLEQAINKHKPQYAIISSVSSRSLDFEDYLATTVQRVVKMDDRTPTPIMNAYSSDSVGADRLAMAVGANAHYPDKNNLVVCLGTCITYNFVQSTRTFRGGAISPGVHMRLRSMHEFTDKLPSVGLQGETLLLGYDTDTCMRSGAVFGIVSEIDGMVEAFKVQYPHFNAILTGGDTAYFAGKLKSEIFADPDIILKGLNIILKHNVPQAS
ncbi:MAG: type III pantothenate kinase [Chitinophagales bacterium]|nr:type III pantothenate kinase [Chitinophagaceae bacterium]MCB9064962.1 type III pantothenate kinase [Chitinophagales bacterium]